MEDFADLLKVIKVLRGQGLTGELRAKMQNVWEGSIISQIFTRGDALPKVR